MDEGCLLFILEAFGHFLFEIAVWVCQTGWNFTTSVTAWLYREGPLAVRFGAHLGTLAGCLWGLGLGIRFCPPEFSLTLTALVSALLATPIGALTGGLAGWGYTMGKR